MKYFASISLLAALLISAASCAFATELKVRGNMDVYGLWSANLRDFDSDIADGDNYMTTQRMRAYFDYVAHENLKAVLGLEIDNDWGATDAADWGTDGKGNIEVKHAYLNFTLPDTSVTIQAGLQYVALPSVFGNPVFDDDAAAFTVSAKINDTVGLSGGYTRGVDGSTNVDNDLLENGTDQDDVDMAFLVAPITLDGFSISPYFAYAWLGENSGKSFEDADDDSTVWVIGTHAKLIMFDPLTFAADLIYGVGENDDYETKGWYTALAATYKMDVLTATLFTTYATGADKEDDEDNSLPTLAPDGFAVTPYFGGVRAFSTGYHSFASDGLGVGSDGTGLWSLGLVLDKITFVENLSHKMILAHIQGTGDEGTSYFTEEDSGWEIYLVNKYTIYENLAAINEFGYFKGSSEGYEADNPNDDDLDASSFATVGFAYKF